MSTNSQKELEIDKAIELLRQALELVPDGDWCARGCYVYRTSDPRDHRQMARVPAMEPVDGFPHPIAAFISRSKSTVPSLLARLREYKDANDKPMFRAKFAEGDTDLLITKLEQSETKVKEIEEQKAQALKKVEVLERILREQESITEYWRDRAHLGEAKQ